MSKVVGLGTLADDITVSNGNANLSKMSLTPSSAPSNPVQGDMYLDSSDNKLKIYNGNSWTAIVIAAPTFPVELLVIGGGGAGGAGGGGNQGGGGGAGGLVTINSLLLQYVKQYNIEIGSPGAGTVGTIGTNGGDSSFTYDNEITFIGRGGGYGGGNGNNPNSGGSGGGVKRDANLDDGGASTQTINFGTYTSIGFGNIGGGRTSGALHSGGGGGGAGGAGYDGDFDNNPTSINGSDSYGGEGKLVSITGSNLYWAGGGGGCVWYGNGGNGGIGGGGGGDALNNTDGLGGGSALNSGSNATGGNGGAGGLNTGSGGGGGGTTGAGGNGGKGIIIIAYPNTYQSLQNIDPSIIVNGGSPGQIIEDTTSRPGYKVYKFTDGTGNISW